MARQIVTQYAHRSNTGSPRPFVFHESNKAHQGRTIRPDLQLYYGNRSGLSDGDLLGDQTCLFTRQRTLRLLQSSLDFLWSLCFPIILFQSRLNLILWPRMFYRHNNVTNIKIKHYMDVFNFAVHTFVPFDLHASLALFTKIKSLEIIPFIWFCFRS